VSDERSRDENAAPPPPNEIDRGVWLHRLQLIGMPFIAALPLLAMFGVFGDRSTSVEASSGALHARVEFPTRLRARPSRPITVTVSNTSAETMDTITVAFDSAYVDRFTGVTFVPSPDEDYTVAMTEVGPGETRRIRVEMQAQKAGAHAGRITIRARDNRLDVPVRTIVFP